MKPDKVLCSRFLRAGFFGLDRAKKKTPYSCLPLRTEELTNRNMLFT